MTEYFWRPKDLADVLECSMSKAYKLAKEYYPAFWNITKLKELVAANLLTPEEFKEITGEEYEDDN